jgi:tetratricopeptide (TPR) repeat protein
MKSRGKGIAIVLLLLVVQWVFQDKVVRPRYMRDFAVKTKSGGGTLSPELLFLQLFGFREFLAGMLWVRADSFFDSGNYDAILPIIRLVTWLDPHYIDVYATGMWHLGYNFTDEESRSDRRYLPFALALGKEGAENNPDTYELFFETGWVWYHKVDDTYSKAVYWFEQANKRRDILPARRNLLAAAYLRNGEPEKALNWYAKLLAEAQERFAKTGDYPSRTNRDTIENNLDNTLVRLTQRGYFAIKRNDGSYERMPFDTRPPFDVGFGVRATVEEPRVLRVEGMWNVLAIGTRIRVILRDADYEHAIPAGMVWDYADSVSLDPPREITFMQDQLYVKNRRFNRRIDMSKDPTMYPFAKDKYVLEFYYNPRSGAAHMQDKFGFNGEGLTDKLFLNEEIRPGTRVVYAKFEFTRDQLLRQGQWMDATPVVQSPNFVPVSGHRLQGDDIIVPGIRAQETPGAATPSAGGGR